MGVGKYSPTVSNSYSKDQEWFEKNGGGFGNGLIPESQYDNQGYDDYGYHGYTDRDRAGYTENDYLTDSIEDGSSGIYDRVMSLWDGYNAPTILDLSGVISNKVSNDALFALDHSKMVAIIHIHESASTARYKLGEAFKAGGSADGHAHYQKEFKAFFAEIEKKMVEHTMFLEDFYEKFLYDFIKIQKKFI